MELVIKIELDTQEPYWMRRYAEFNKDGVKCVLTVGALTFAKEYAL